NDSYSVGSDLKKRNYKNFVMLCDAATGKEIRRLPVAGYYWAWAAAFSPDGQKLAIKNGQSTLSLWDLKKGKELFSFKSFPTTNEGFIFSPDGKYLVSRFPLLDSSRAQVVHIGVWDTATGKKLRHFGAGKLGDAWEFALADDGKTMVSENHRFLRSFG